MRKALAIFFLSIILLNIAGYYLVFEGWKWHNSITWSFDENASNAHELIVEIPLNVPYATQERDWESADGQFEHKGEIYRIVRHKITTDAIFIACVKDNESSRINDQLQDFAKTFTDKPLDGKQNVKAFPSFIKEYVSQVVTVRSSVSGWSQSVAFTIPAQTLIPSFFSSIVHPPERIA
jgi:hypothetical protein